MDDMRNELEALRYGLGVYKKVFYTKEEGKEFRELEKNMQPLPSEVHADDDGYDRYFKYVKSDLSEEEIKELLLYRQTGYLRSIKNSLTFFVVLVILYLVGRLILLLLIT